MGFSTIDYVVLLVYLAGITVFGMRFKQAQRSVKDYFVGARNTSWIIICLSIVATETSTLTLIGVPALAYGTFARPEQGGTLTYLQVADRLHHRPLHHRAPVPAVVLPRRSADGVRAARAPLRRGGAPRRRVAVSDHARAGRRRPRVCRVARAVRGARVELPGHSASVAVVDRDRRRADARSTRSKAASPPSSGRT